MDRVLVIYFGRIVESGTVAEVFNDREHPYTRALLNSVPSIDPFQRHRLKPFEGDLPSPLRSPPGRAFAPRCPHAAHDCTARPPLLGPIGTGEAACYHPLCSSAQRWFEAANASSPPPMSLARNTRQCNWQILVNRNDSVLLQLL